MHCSTYWFTGTYDVVSINLGNGWSPSINGFIAPVTGIYYFSVSFGVPAGGGIDSFLTVESSNVCSIDGYNSDGLGVDVYSSGCLVNVTSGESVTITIYGVGYSAYGETSFRGFLYSLEQDKTTIAWSVQKQDNNQDFTGVLSYDFIRVNVGGAWSKTNNKVVIPTSGTYYVEIVGTTFGGTFDMQLKLFETTVLSRLLFMYDTSLPWVTRSRSVLVNLKVGDLLTVGCSSCSLYGSKTSFQGIMLHSN